jgi:hypothetical protein
MGQTNISSIQYLGRCLRVYVTVFTGFGCCGHKFQGIQWIPSGSKSPQGSGKAESILSLGKLFGLVANGLPCVQSRSLWRLLTPASDVYIETLRII